MHIIVACSLAAAVGFGIGCFFGPGKTQLSANDVNFGYSENIKSFDTCDKFTAKNILTADYDNKRLKKNNIIKENDREKPLNIVNIKNNFDSFRDILLKVKLSLDTLCSMVEDNRKIKTTNKHNACDENSSILDLIELKNNVKNIITKTAFAEDNSHQRFIDNMESRLNNISLIYFDDLSKTIKTTVTKVDRKLNKVRRKLNQRLCIIKNTIGDDPKIVELLKTQKDLTENCANEKGTREKESETKKFERMEKIKNTEINYEKFPVGPEVKSEINQQIKVNK